MKDFQNILIYLIGNKTDLEDKRQVPKESAKKFAEENNLVFYETSALNGSNIEEIFVKSATTLVEKLEAGELQNELNSSGIKIFKYPNKVMEEKINQNKKGGCC